MRKPSQILTRILALLLGLLALAGHAKDIPEQLPAPDNRPPLSNKPVQVYILSGQSNMVGMGDISGAGVRWGSEFLDPVVSVYPGAYDPEADYDRMTPLKTLKLASFGGVEPTPFPGGGTRVVRGQIRMKQTGMYDFRPGYDDSTHNIMEVNGVEVHRKTVGGKPVKNLVRLKAGEAVPFKITYLTGGAKGLGWVAREDIPGTLSNLVHKEGKFQHLIDDDGRWTVRNDVIYKGVISAEAQGPLKPGIQGNTIGPELQFGHVMGYYHDEPVLLIKASIGNRSLGWDLLPPGSKRFTVRNWTYAGYKDSPEYWRTDTEPKPISWYAGKQYDDYTASIHKVLKNFDTLFPAFRDQGYQIAGFVWWQGHKDGDEAYANRYEQNLVNLIKAWRLEFKAPTAPFVLATIGFGGWSMTGPHRIVADAQLAVSGVMGNYPEFAGNVHTVESRDFWRDASVSPKSQDYHYNRNAETYMLVGDALGRAMVMLKEGKQPKPPKTPPASVLGQGLPDAGALDMPRTFAGVPR